MWKSTWTYLLILTQMVSATDILAQLAMPINSGAAQNTTVNSTPFTPPPPPPPTSNPEIQNLIATNKTIILITTRELGEWKPEISASNGEPGLSENGDFQSVVPGFSVSANQNAPAAVLMVDSVAQAGRIMGTARNILPKLETLLFSGWVAKAGKAPTANQARPQYKYVPTRGISQNERTYTEVQDEEPNIHELGTLLASAKETNSVITRDTAKQLWLSMDKKASEFGLSLWIVCYCLFNPKGKSFLPWSVSRAIHKSNIFYNGLFDEMTRIAKEPGNVVKKQQKLEILKLALTNPDLKDVRSWLSDLGKTVVIEKEDLPDAKIDRDKPQTSSDVEFDSKTR